MNETPRGSWASSIFDLKQSQADALLPNLFDRISYDDVDRNNENLRQQNRHDNIFSLYPPQDEVRSSIKKNLEFSISVKLQRFSLGLTLCIFI